MQGLKVVVKEIEGFCDTMEVGDYFIVRGGRLSIPEGHFCYWALNSILPPPAGEAEEDRRAGRLDAHHLGGRVPRPEGAGNHADDPHRPRVGAQPLTNPFFRETILEARSEKDEISSNSLQIVFITLSIHSQARFLFGNNSKMSEYFRD